MGGDMAADAAWPLLLLGIVPGCLGHGIVGGQGAPSMTYPDQIVPEEAWLHLALSSAAHEKDPAAWMRKKLEQSHGEKEIPCAGLPSTLVNMFGVGVPQKTGLKNLWPGRGAVEKKNNRVERRGDVLKVVPWDLMYFSHMLRG